jgi:hypothetical protein
MPRRTSMILLLLFASLSAAPVWASDRPALEGVYMSFGTNPDGSEYHGVVDIERQGDRFLVTWMFPRLTGEVLTLELAAVGVGIARDGMLAVSYYGSKGTGLVLYRIEDDAQQLVGEWTVAGDDSELHPETLTRTSKHPTAPAGASPEEAAPTREEAPPVRPEPPRPVHSWRAGTVQL